jgi:hypothetical protein
MVQNKTTSKISEKNFAHFYIKIILVKFVSLNENAKVYYEKIPVFKKKFYEFFVTGMNPLFSST